MIAKAGFRKAFDGKSLLVVLKHSFFKSHHYNTYWEKWIVLETKAYIAGGALIVILLSLIGIIMTYGPSEVQLTEADNGSTVELKSGQILSITLEANPTTGYTWDVVEAPDERIMRQVGEIDFKPESEAIGAGGVQIIRFEVVNAGQTNLTLIYHRPWETDVEPLKTFAVHAVAR